MGKYFKCCQNKIFVNYICIRCINIFHQSCLERMKNVKILKGYRVICSIECAEKDDSCAGVENDPEELLKELNELLGNKDIDIGNLKNLEINFLNLTEKLLQIGTSNRC
ncbi:unnamed protein product [Psylliodes chrysocephalus]|uniref:Uncharacterized protein n=1 Tax=Psylliodes chrysocephalus TaxID=3402493 RepID=A0A9P0CA10_9CUCU|nr:unnamed protein product [Psylliodes chrysocephala]